jgi:hypothetical protein
MIAWIKKINWGKTVLVGLIYTVFAAVVQSIVGQLKAGIMSVVLTFAIGISIAVIYYYIKEMLPKKFLKRVFFFADLMIGFSFIFFTIPVYLLVNVPVGVLVTWFIGSFITLVYASFITVKLLGM